MGQSYSFVRRSSTCHCCMAACRRLEIFDRRPFAAPGTTASTTVRRSQLLTAPGPRATPDECLRGERQLRTDSTRSRSSCTRCCEDSTSGRRWTWTWCKHPPRAHTNTPCASRLLSLGSRLMAPLAARSLAVLPPRPWGSCTRGKPESWPSYPGRGTGAREAPKLF